MNLFSLNLQTTKVVFSKHAKERTMQRARLFLFQVEKDNLDWFLRNNFKTSCIDNKFFNCPFYINKEQGLFGKGSFICKSDLLTFHCKLRNDGIIMVCTVTLNREENNE